MTFAFYIYRSLFMTRFSYNPGFYYFVIHKPSAFIEFQLNVIYFSSRISDC